MNYYIAPQSSGTGDGSSWANAAGITSLAKIVDKASGGDSVLLRADAGDYVIKNSLNLYTGGSNGNPIVIKGVDVAGNDMAATFVSNRAAVFSTTAAQGSEIFRINDGADNLSFQNMAFENVNSAFRVTGDVSNISIAHMTADNVSRFFDDYATGTATSATISGLEIRDVEVSGFSKGVIKLQYDTHDVVIDNVRGDSQFIDGANFATGVALEDTVHDVVIRNSEMGNIKDTTNAYHNGDGFATEENVYRVLFENVRAYNNTDAGFDIKSSETTLINVVAEENTRNYRFWSDVTANNITSKSPVYHGGTSTTANFWFYGGNDVTMTNVVVDDASATNWLYDFYTGGGTLTLRNAVASDSSILGNVRTSGSLISGKTVMSTAVKGDAEIASILGEFNIGTDNSKLMMGSAGADTVVAKIGTSYVVTGQGNDIIIDSATSKFLAGGSGDDQYLVTNAKNLVYELKGGGFDTVKTTLDRYNLTDNVEKVVYVGDGSFNGKGNDLGNVMIGGNKADTLSGGDGDDNLYGGGGADVLRGDAGADYIDSGDGDDVVEGGAGNDLLIAGNGNDTLRGNGGKDFMVGGEGDDLLVGDDVTVNSSTPADADTLHGGNGNDLLYGDALTITSGRAGNDIIYGDKGDDTLFGDALNATGRSVMGNDIIYGGDGNDRLYGDAKTASSTVTGGSNWLSGGNGDDRLYGGSQQDVFAFSKGEVGSDIISGFSQSGSGRDYIELSGYGVTFQDLTISYTQNNAVIEVDAHETITVFGVSHLSASDFHLL